MLFEVINFFSRTPSPITDSEIMDFSINKLSPKETFGPITEFEIETFSPI